MQRFCVIDEEDTVRAEGICCQKHAQVVADALIIATAPPKPSFEKPAKL